MSLIPPPEIPSIIPLIYSPPPKIAFHNIKLCLIAIEPIRKYEAVCLGLFVAWEWGQDARRALWRTLAVQTRGRSPVSLFLCSLIRRPLHPPSVSSYLTAMSQYDERLLASAPAATRAEKQVRLFLFSLVRKRTALTTIFACFSSSLVYRKVIMSIC